METMVFEAEMSIVRGDYRLFGVSSLGCKLLTGFLPSIHGYSGGKG